MIIEVTNEKRNTYKHRHTLASLGLRFEHHKWIIKTNDNDITNHIIEYCRKKHLMYYVIEDKYNRSADYRNMFLQQHPKIKGKYYRCAYCGKKIMENDITVDHIIPVDKVKHKKRYRWLLRLMKIDNVNSYANLTPSCEKCNKKKGRKFDLRYYLLATSGKFPSGIIARRFINFICVVLYLTDIFLLIALFLNIVN